MAVLLCKDAMFFHDLVFWRFGHPYVPSFLTDFQFVLRVGSNLKSRRGGGVGRNVICVQCTKLFHFWCILSRFSTSLRGRGHSLNKTMVVL